MPQNPTLAKAKQTQYPITYEVESGSESDLAPKKKGPLKVIDIIEISSDSDEEPIQPNKNRKESSPTPPLETPAKKRIYSRRKIVESSDEDSDAASDEEVLELSDGSSGDKPVPPKRRPLPALPKATEISDAAKDSEPSNSDSSPFDESTIVFDEPRAARKPVRVKPPSQASVDRTTGDKDDALPTITNLPSGSNTPKDPAAPRPASPPTAQKATATKPKAPTKTPRRNTKKAREEAELLRRQEYAQQVFDDLNKSVFAEGLPSSTKLVWNKRLLTTAGKAKYHRNREGVTTTQIELAEKILDCDERIRNTLSHEMCHLATWVIDQKINEHHGSFFKRWAYLVEKKHPHIEVSVKHNYEISYPYEWKCEKCAMIYGRFSKSIKPEECLCGACREGKLVPQFSVRAKAATPKLSRMAAARPQDSPRAVQALPTIPGTLDSDSEDDVIRALTQTLATTALEA